MVVCIIFELFLLVITPQASWTAIVSTTVTTTYIQAHADTRGFSESKKLKKVIEKNVFSHCQ